MEAEPETIVEANAKSSESLKPVPKPDEVELKQKIDETNDKVAALQTRLTALKESLEARETGRGDSPEAALAKGRLNEVKGRSRMLQQEKRNIYDQISAADDLKKQQQDLTQRLKAQLTLFSVDEIERKIKALEHQQQTTSLSVKDDKKIIEDIKRLAANKPMIRQYDEAQESLKGVREHHTTLYNQLKAKNADLTLVKEEEEKCRECLEAAKAKDDAKRADVPSLFKERDTIRKEIIEHRDHIRKLRDEFNEKRKEWQNYVRVQKEIKYKEWAERKAARQAEYEAQKKAFEEEMAKRDPWEEEKAIVEQLIVYVEKYLPKREEGKVEEKLIEHPAGTKPLQKADLDGDDPYANLVKKKSKRKGGPVGGDKSLGATKQKPMKLALSPEDFVLWDKLGFKPPSTTEDCPALLDELVAKREWLKTAPPKQKKPASETTNGKAASLPPKPPEEEDAPEDEVDEAEAEAPDGSSRHQNGTHSAPELIQLKATSDSQVAVRLVLAGRAQ